MTRFLSLSILSVLFMLSACSTARKAGTAKAAPVKSPVGVWETVVSGTPMGDVQSELSIMMEGDAYKGTLGANGQQIPLNNLKVEGNHITCSFYYPEAGSDITIDATWKEETDTLEGWVMDSFRLTGKRKAETK